MNITIFTVALVGLMFVSCSPDYGPEPYDDPLIDIELRAQFLNLCGYLGETRSDTITAIIRDAMGVAIQGKRIDFGIINPLPWKGLLYKLWSDTLSDQDGKVRAVYRTTFEQSGRVVIEARSGANASRLTLTLTAISDTMDLILFVHSSHNRTSIPHDSTVSIPVTAFIVGANDTTFSGILVNFEPYPGSVFLGSITPTWAITDAFGNAKVDYHSSANQYGVFGILATTFRDSGSVWISINEP